MFFSENVEIHVNMIRDNLPISDDKWVEIQKETQKEDVLVELQHYYTHGWPKDISLCSQTARQYWHYRDEISVIDKVLLKNNRIVIPDVLRPSVLQKLHMGHLGIEKIRRLARTSVFWPRMNKDIEEMSKSCETCQKFQNQQTAEPLLHNQVPTHPWQHISVDFCTYKGHNYLVVVDHYSFYPEVISVPTTSAPVAIKLLKSLFARHGIPQTMRADNMPFGSEEMRQFSIEWEFEIKTSSPEYPKSNRLAEKGVQVVKNLIKKSLDSGEDINFALLAFRSAPNEFGLSPAQLLFGRKIKSRIPILETELFGRYDSKNQEDMRSKQVKQKRYHDIHAKSLPELRTGDKVNIRTKTGWKKQGTVVKTDVGPRSYLVDTGHNTLRRNRVHLRNVPMTRRFKRENAYEDDMLDDAVVVDNYNSIVPSDTAPVQHPDNLPGSPHEAPVCSQECTSMSSNNTDTDNSSTSVRRSSRIRKSKQDSDYEYY